MSGPPTASTSGRPAASGRIRSASSIATFANPTCRMIGCARSQSMMIGRSILPRTSSGTSGGTAFTNTKRPGPARSGVTESRTTTSASAIPPWYWSGVRISSETWGVGPEDLFEEEVARAHEQDVDLARRRQHRVGDVVHREVVIDLEARRDDAATAVAEREHDRAPHTRLERHIFLGDLPAVELEGEREGLGLGRVVHQRDERLIVGGAEIAPPDRQARDADVPAPPPPADPVESRVRERLGVRQRERAVGEDEIGRAHV